MRQFRTVDYATIKAALASGGPTCPSITDATLNGVCQLTGAQLQIAQAIAHQPGEHRADLQLHDAVDRRYARAGLGRPPRLTPQAQRRPASPPTRSMRMLPGHADIYVGVLSIPYYLSKAQPLTGSWTAPPFPLDKSSTFVTRFNPLPVATQTLLIPVLATVPNAKSLRAGGWPAPPRRLAGVDFPARHHAQPRGHVWCRRLVRRCRLCRRGDRPAAARRDEHQGPAVCERRQPPVRGAWAADGPDVHRTHLRSRADHTGHDRSFRLALHQPDEPADLARQQLARAWRTSSRSPALGGRRDLANAGGITPSVAGHTHYLGHSLGAIVGGYSWRRTGER